jgi:hypothetical protein
MDTISNEFVPSSLLSEFGPELIEQKVIEILAWAGGISNISMTYNTKSEGVGSYAYLIYFTGFVSHQARIDVNSVFTSESAKDER